MVQRLRDCVTHAGNPHFMLHSVSPASSCKQPHSHPRNPQKRHRFVAPVFDQNKPYSLFRPNNTMHDPDPDYLRPDFNPSSVTKARLRSILVAHDVPYPSNAGKAQLAALVTEKILPRAAEMLAARQNIVPSAEGIVDAAVGQTVKTHSRTHSRQQSAQK